MEIETNMKQTILVTRDSAPINALQAAETTEVRTWPLLSASSLA
jgi:hypothetical protein